MNSDYLLEDLHRAVSESDYITVHEVLWDNSLFFNNPHNNEVVKSILLSLSKICNEDVMNSLVNLLKLRSVAQIELLIAILRGNVHSVKLLLSKGAKVKDPEFLKKDLLVSCLFDRRKNLNTCKEILILLMECGLNLLCKNYQGQNILHQFIDCVQKDDFDAADVAKIIINFGELVDESDYEGSVPLVKSICKQNVRLVKLLIYKGADVNKKNHHSQESPLHLAVHYENEDIVDLLLSNGAEINAKSILGVTALHDACSRNCEQMINFLIQKGANVNIEDEMGRTPFSLLKPEIENYSKCIYIMIEEFAKLTFENISATQNDLDLIQSNLIAREHFVKCKDELDRMVKTKFYASYSYYFVFKITRKSFTKCVYLSRNEEFISKFEENLGTFSHYQRKLKNNLERVIEVRNKLGATYSCLYSIFIDLLPDVVIRKLAENLTLGNEMF